MSDEAKMTVRPDGPYLVRGVRLRRRDWVETEHGEPIAWTAGEVLNEGVDNLALCRCGGSANKPYCDGTHAENGFDGTESAATDGYADRAKDYEGAGIVVHDDRPLCVHAGFCGTKATNVWKMTSSADDTHVRSQIAAMVERCPSGALSYELEGTEIEPLLPAEITVVPDGPLWLTGGIAVERADGEPLETRNRVTLCRCGASENKPLCDGSHKEAGFTG